MTVDAETLRRSARREFVKAHHPDRGGDADSFRTGLARFDHTAQLLADHRPTVYRSRRVDRWLRHGWRAVRRRLRGEPPRLLR